MNNKNKGIIFIILSSLSFAMMSFFIQLSGDIPFMQKSFFRNVIALIVSLIIILKSKQGFKFQKENLTLLILRSIFGTLGIFLNFYAIENLILSDATMINKLSPFFVIIFSIFILKEKVKLWQIATILVAFIGSVFIINPNIILSLFNNQSLTNGINKFPALIGVIGAMCAGIAYTFIRLLSNRGEKGTFIVFFFSAFSCLLTLPFLLISYKTMSFSQSIYLILAGIFASLGQFSITAAYSNAPAKEISIFDYSQIIFSAILGFIVFGQIPTIYSFIGYFIIICAAIFMFIMNNKKSK